MSDFTKNLTKEMAEVVQASEQKAKLIDSLKAKGLKTQASIDKYVANKKWLRDTLYADTFVAFGDTELVYDPAKKVWNLDVATSNMFEGNPHAQAWFAKKYPGKDLSKMGKGELARASLKYVPDFLNEVPPPNSNIILKGSTISAETAPKFGLKTTGAKKKGLYQRLWGNLPGFQELSDGSLMFSKRLLKIGSQIPKPVLKIGGAAAGTIPFLGIGVDAAQFGSDLHTAVKQPTGKNIRNTIGSGLELADQTPFMLGPLMNASIRSKKNVDMSPNERLKAINSIKYIK